MVKGLHDKQTRFREIGKANTPVSYLQEEKGDW